MTPRESFDQRDTSFRVIEVGQPLRARLSPLAGGVPLQRLAGSGRVPDLDRFAEAPRHCVREDRERRAVRRRLT
jgi:hypothetical protein